MLEKPDFPDEKIIACLQAEYGVRGIQLTFLPLGADQNTAVYRAASDKGTAYFVKLRQGGFDEMAVSLPRFLNDRGITQVIAPMATISGQLQSSLEPFGLILSPFIEGQDGYEVNLSDRQWIEFGTILRRIHSTEIPAALREGIPQERFSSHWRDGLTTFLIRIENNGFDDPIAAETAVFIRARRDEIGELIRRTESLAQSLMVRPLDSTLCHADIHAGNLLITAEEGIYLVDWDNPILAPKERDLMSIGGGLFGGWRTPENEEALFYQGYGQTKIDPSTLAYYRYERIVQDLEVECEQLFVTTEGSKDREQTLRFLKSNFLPGNVLEIAHLSDKAPK